MNRTDNDCFTLRVTPGEGALAAAFAALPETGPARVLLAPGRVSGEGRAGPAGHHP